jgi:ADP-ribosylation factor 1/2
MLGKQAYYVNILFNQDKLKLDENVVTIPTIGFNVEKVKYNKVQFTMWDIGGQNKIRTLWRYYYNNTNAVIFVVDSNDTDRIKEAADELSHVMQDEILKDSVLLVLANKQDLKNAMDVTEMKENLKLYNIKQQWYLQPCSAHTGDGIFEGLDWLSKQLN